MSSDNFTRAAEIVASIPKGNFINGQWVDGAKTFTVEDPATGTVIAEMTDAAPADAIAALDAAVAKQKEWANTPARVRGEMLRKAWELTQERKEDLALLMAYEMGKPVAEARGEVAYGSEFLRWFAEEAPRVAGRYGDNPEGTGKTIVSQMPVGPVYFITPWNFPFAMATRKIAPAIAAGCTVVIKPPQNTPLTTAFFTEILNDAGVPAGVVNVIQSESAREVSAPIIADPRLRKLSFTGSTAVGKKLIAQAAENVLRVSMELGGNAPFVVFEDADMDKAIEGAMLAKFRNIGQACTAANRFIVQDTIADEFTKRITERVKAMKIGPGLAEDSQIGALINQKAVDDVDALVKDAVAKGATLVTGGEPVAGDGTFYPPTVLTNVPRDSRIWKEEIFGPVLPITTFHDEAEAVEMANDTEYGLVSYVYTTDLGRAHRMVDEIDTGMMGLNTGLVSNASAPFGGVKASGVGREGGDEGIHEFLETKYTLLAN